MARLVDTLTDADTAQLSILAARSYLCARPVTTGWFLNERFVLPALIYRRAGIRWATVTVETGLFPSKLEPPPDSAEIEFLDQVLAGARQAGIHFFTQPLTTAVFKVVPTGTPHAPFSTYTNDLTLSRERLWDNLHGKHRNVIRKASTSGVEIRFGQELADLAIRLHHETLAREGCQALPADYWQSLRTAAASITEYAVAFRQGQPQGSAILIWNQNGAYYLHGGSVVKPFGGALNLLHWEAMLEMKRRGVAKYDFAGARVNAEPGSKPETLARFKERFGGTHRTGFLWKAVLCPLRYQAFRLLVRTHARLTGRPAPGPDIIAQHRDSHEVVVSDL